MNNPGDESPRLFHFKQFSLTDSGCAMKIGTDGVLLGAFSAALALEKKCSLVLDVGSGCGIIALMIAQKSRAMIHAIDINDQAASVAGHNFRNSPWSDRLLSYHSSLQQFKPDACYDLIVSNPPFFQASLHSPDTARTIARHDKSLGLDELFRCSHSMVSASGKLVIIYPANLEDLAQKAASEQHFFEYERLWISSSPQHKAKRIISCYSLSPSTEVITRSIGIETGTRHQFTEDYKSLTGDYHPFL